MKEYFKIMKLKSELSKSLLFLPYGINSFFTLKPSKIALAQFICITYSVQFFGQFLTSPNTRACRQTNSSEGGFVQNEFLRGRIRKKSPFHFFFLFFFIIFLSSYFFLSSPLFPVVLFLVVLGHF